ncbi:cardiolipin-specific phospholipase, partial [Phenoliferia sp. Uapishka_3]
MTASTAAAAAYAFPSDVRSSLSHWWHAPKDAGLVAEEGLLRRGLESVELVSPEVAEKRATQGATKKIAVFRDVAMDGLGVKGTDRKRYVLHALEVGKPVKERDECTTIVTHGYGNGLGFYFQNLNALTAPTNTRTFFLDWLGMGRSGRPNFPSIKTGDESQEGIRSRVTQAENFFVDSLEEFRIKSNITTPFTLVGHSIGGYLSSAYSIRYPQHVKKLILISPVGVPLSPYAPAKGKDSHKTIQEEGNEIAASLEQQMLPSGSASAEVNDLPAAPTPQLADASRRFATFEDDVKQDLFTYLYGISTARGSGEYCLAHLLAPGAYGRWPLLTRLDQLDIPITFIYGDHDWMDKKGGYDVVKRLKAKPVTPETERQKKDSKVIINPHSGHWVHLENPEGFNRIIESELRS